MRGPNPRAWLFGISDQSLSGRPSNPRVTAMQAYAPLRILSVGFAALATAFLIGSAPAGAKDIDGVYVVDGRDVGRETYKGVAEIRRSGPTYQMVWQIGPTAFVGTGLYAQGVLSVAFRDMQGRVLGLGVYSLQDDKTLAGLFTFVGSNRTGSEMLSPVEGHPPPKPPTPERK